jgi:DNA recombination protein RmuC
MNSAVVIAVLIIGMLVLGGFLYLLQQHFTLKLTKANNEQRKGNKEEIESGVKGILEDNQKLLAEIVHGLEKQLEGSSREVGDLKKQNAAIREQLENTAKVTQGLQVSTEGLKSLLSNNRLRGDWGEQIAEDLLLAAGFVEKVNYTKQTTSGEGRPDFTILLPDGSKLNVDAKFPFDNLIAYQEAENETTKKQVLAKFRSDVKSKVTSITSKDYINPQDNTLDFVIMFIPNEMIFSFIYEKLPDLNDYCNERKVVLAGPFGFTAVLRLVLQAYKNFKYEKGLQQIFALISKFQSEYAKYGEGMEKLGKQLETAQKTYFEVEGTRNRQLTKVVDQITNQSQLSEVPTDNSLSATNEE